MEIKTPLFGGKKKEDDAMEKSMTSSMTAGQIGKIVEATSNLTVRRVRVDRSRSPQEMLDATGRRQYTDRDVVETMPRGEGDEEIEIFFLKLHRCVSDEEVEKEFASRGSVAADPYSLVAVNEADPIFADECPNCTHWKDDNGNWCYMAFRRWRGERYVRVRRDDYDWDGRWWFAGLRK